MHASTLSSPRRGSLGRIRNLFAGWLSLWVRDRERENPRAVYEQAIQGRLARYAELKEAVAGILYLRNKLEAEIRERRTEMSRLSADAERAVRRGDETLAVAVVTHRHELIGEPERAEQELEGLRRSRRSQGEPTGLRDGGLEREKGRASRCGRGACAARAPDRGSAGDADVRA
jgi:hypothetical protein